ncbi:MAG: YbaK/EbsC family protein [Anaerovoracaceae bacterium]|jgi:prolyl-tRNA editing enzyme YbaK/EbsC (Cys-tRNA(Pro) deacylase)
MAQEQVREYFRQLGIEDKLIKLHESSATVEMAAQALGTEPRRIAKTLSFLTDDGPIVIVMAGDAKVDNRKFKDNFHTKAKMVPHDDVEEIIGHAAGGVCPFALKDGVKSYLDESLKRFDTVFPAAGSIYDVTELTCDELEKYAENFSGWIDVTKGWQDVENQ